MTARSGGRITGTQAIGTKTWTVDVPWGQIVVPNELLSERLRGFLNELGDKFQRRIEISPSRAVTSSCRGSGDHLAFAGDAGHHADLLVGELRVVADQILFQAPGVAPEGKGAATSQTWHPSPKGICCNTWSHNSVAGFRRRRFMRVTASSSNGSRVASVRS